MAQQAILDRITIKYRRQIAREIARAMVQGVVGQHLALVEMEHERRLGSILKQLWAETIRRFTTRLTGRQSTMKRESLLPRTEVAAAIMRGWTITAGGRKITQIVDTTMMQINEIVAQAAIDGITERALAKLIREVAPVKSASRAQTIARTESHESSQFTAHYIAEHTDVDLVKVWASAQDDRTREDEFDHTAMDGVVVEMNEMFSVPGVNGPEELLYPGDVNGSAANVINCRCAALYVPRGTVL